MGFLRSTAVRTIAAAGVLAATLTMASPASAATESVLIDSPSGTFFSVDNPAHNQCFDLGKDLPAGEVFHNNTHYVVYYYTYPRCYSDRDGEIAPGQSLTEEVMSFQVTDHT
jgi:hypothetical protein